jgi:predicted transcriptional regulator
MSRILLISVKPEFAEKIIAGEKTIELRKACPKAKKDDIVIIYATVPVKAVIGICRVEDIISLAPSTMWRYHNEKLGIDRKRYLAYYEYTDRAVGIVLKSACRLNTSIELSAIKKMFPKFSPPQTFRYYSKIEILRIYTNRFATESYILE